MQRSGRAFRGAAGGRLAPAAHARGPTPNAVDAGVVRRALMIIGDLLAGVGLILGVPFVILAIGIPIALGLRFLLWIAGLL